MANTPFIYKDKVRAQISYLHCLMIKYPNKSNLIVNFGSKFLSIMVGKGMLARPCDSWSHCIDQR